MSAVDFTEQVIADFLVSWNAFNDAKLDPGNQAAIEAAAESATGEQREVIPVRLAFFVANNYRAVVFADLPASATVDPASVTIVGDVATLRFCDLDSNVLVETGGLPDGGDAVVDESITARTVDVELLRSSKGRWLVDSATVLEEFPGSSTCRG